MSTQPATHTPGPCDTGSRVARLAYGYELMHRAICNMAGTSGAEGRWYMHIAQEVQQRVSPVWNITPNSNPSKPGDCLTNYLSAVPNVSGGTNAELIEAVEGLIEMAEAYGLAIDARVIHAQTAIAKVQQAAIWPEVAKRKQFAA